MPARTYRNKIVVIAGGASGIGEQLARQLVDVGARVVVLDRNSDAGTALSQATPEIEYNMVDMTNVDLVRRSVRHIVKKHGHVDYFFNCAGVFMAGEIRDTPIEDWDRITAANLGPIWNGTSVAYAAMQKQGFGHIVNIASSAGLFPVPAMTIYGATKAAVVSLTLGLRNEARSLGIAVSVVCPTIVNTPLYQTALYAGVNRKKVLRILKESTSFQTPDVAARRILRNVLRNKAVIHTANSTRAAWFIFRISTQLYGAATGQAFTKYRATLRLQK